MTSHYAQAEALLAEGLTVIQKINNAPDEWHPYGRGGGENRGDWVRKRRDDLGKQAMGIWAQAQVHATLALIEGKVDQ